MLDFDTLAAKYTSKEDQQVPGVQAKCVDKNGKELYSKLVGFNGPSPDAGPLRADAAFKIGSATKLITSIALLQCVDKGLITLDDPITGLLPELDGKPIVTGMDLSMIPSNTKITARQLLTHTSGIPYGFLHPFVIKWRTTPEGLEFKNSRLTHERFNVPLVFEPGTGWMYGGSLDWAGVAVRRLHDNIPLEEYMIENIWKRVGRTSPFPTFNLGLRDEDYQAKLMQAAQRDAQGRLQPFEFEFGHNPVDAEGGSGMVATADDFLAVLADLVSDSPKLLKPETISDMFSPQLQKGSKSTEMLVQLRPAWDNVAGPVASETVNHGLGGVLIQGEAAELGQPANLLGWGGALNTIWFASKELGVACFFSTQVSPFGDSKARELIDAWKKEFWAQFKAT
ncbi:hypothetical protein H072_1043 [Dactylellina haptotyla CBS 200.50]|uniref:Beta-lactamase-related domain-containing protein n=1 Tax=Dactylellina haptotyla (strain CBS 200.50) TaxID=1284197 RepID=S8CBD1_DACHA|nr:hypothetical protein H072_1043 [Dactylellina haptotyla CBS 200.50]